MKHTARIRLFLGLAAWIGLASGFAADSSIKMPWGTIASKGDRHEVRVDQWPANRLLPLSPPFPNIVSAWIIGDDGTSTQSIHWMFNPDATQIALGLPPFEPGRKASIIQLFTTEKTTEHADSTLVLSALDAKVVGDKAKLETNPGNHRIGYWSNPRDHVEWNFETKGHGRYEVEIAFSRSGRAGARLMLSIDDQELPVTLATTGNWYVYTGQSAGMITIAKPGRHVARVRCVDPAGGAVMNLKALVLRPRP